MKICITCNTEKSPDSFYVGRRKCKFCYLEQKREFVKNNHQRVMDSKRQYRKDNQEQVRRYKKEYYHKNKDSILKYNKEYKKGYHQRRLLTDTVYKMKYIVRNLIRCSLWKRGYTKKSRTYKILGLQYRDFKLYMERQFVEGMSWDNHGKWHIDHIIPIASAQSEDDVLRLNHYTNLQPLWAADNLSKGSKIL